MVIRLDSVRLAHGAALVAVCSFALAAAGCESNGEPDDSTVEAGGGGAGAGGSNAGGAANTGDGGPEFPEGTGQLATERLPYPEGPFGFHEGSIIENYKLWGFADSTVDSESVALIELAMFYNPTGDGVYPAGSPFGEGNAKPKALVINVGAVWCGPCNQEADEVLPVEYANYKPMGGQFLSLLADGPTVGKPATPNNLVNWAHKYEPSFPLVLDPAYKLGDLFVADAYPQNMIVDLRTMEVVEIVAGVPDAAFWTKFESVLD
ncbi:MAG: TlpA family protein disulfide reductase [Polyangiaceae bacterium]|nr:TlpA family protein disulfide reductase [Polyangiaceae bacterium]